MPSYIFIPGSPRIHPLSCLHAGPEFNSPSHIVKNLAARPQSRHGRKRERGRRPQFQAPPDSARVLILPDTQKSSEQQYTTPNVLRVCTNCVRCTGERPRCGNCAELGLRCIYEYPNDSDNPGPSSVTAEHYHKEGDRHLTRSQGPRRIR